MIRGKNSSAPVLAQFSKGLIIIWWATSVDVVVVLGTRDVDGQCLWSTVLLHGTKKVGAVILGEDPGFVNAGAVPLGGDSIPGNRCDLLDLVAVGPDGLWGKVWALHSWELLVALELVRNGVAELGETPFGLNAHESVAAKLVVLILLLEIEINSEVHIGCCLCGVGSGVVLGVQTV